MSKEDDMRAESNENCDNGTCKRCDKRREANEKFKKIIINNRGTSGCLGCSCCLLIVVVVVGLFILALVGGGVYFFKHVL